LLADNSKIWQVDIKVKDSIFPIFEKRNIDEDKKRRMQVVNEAGKMARK